MVCIRNASIAELMIAAIKTRVKQRPKVVEVEFSISLRQKRWKDQYIINHQSISVRISGRPPTAMLEREASEEKEGRPQQARLFDGTSKPLRTDVSTLRNPVKTRSV
jgi:hypothetical protein